MLHIAPEPSALIKAMAVNNRLWGAKRIRGELLKLGIAVNKRTMRRYMHQARRAYREILSSVPLGGSSDGVSSSLARIVVKHAAQAVSPMNYAG
jgi:hypothetical protein